MKINPRSIYIRPIRVVVKRGEVVTGAGNQGKGTTGVTLSSFEKKSKTHPGPQPVPGALRVLIKQTQSAKTTGAPHSPALPHR